ncbi:hypothetical protein OROHE_005856 [Orobanche hederae]
MPVESVTVGRDEVLPAANSSRPSLPPSPPQLIDMLLQEIKEINQRFMEVKVDVMNMDSVLKVGFDEGVVIWCSYNPVGQASQQMVHKLLLELILPVKYPTISPTASKRMPHGCGHFNNGSLCIVYVAPLSALCVGCVARLVGREPIDMLLQEIKEINQRFMEVKVDVMNMDRVLKIGFDEGVVIWCSYVPVGQASQQMIHKLLLELIVPVKYPTISPTASKRMPHGCGDSEDGIFFGPRQTRILVYD